jgi:hypothetical protein
LDVLPVKMGHKKVPSTHESEGLILPVKMPQKRYRFQGKMVVIIPGLRDPETNTLPTEIPEPSCERLDLAGPVAMGAGSYRGLDRTLFRDSEYHRRRRRVKTVRRSSI